MFRGRKMAAEAPARQAPARLHVNSPHVDLVRAECLLVLPLDFNGEIPGPPHRRRPGPASQELTTATASTGAEASDGQACGAGCHRKFTTRHPVSHSRPPRFEVNRAFQRKKRAKPPEAISRPSRKVSAGPISLVSSASAISRRISPKRSSMGGSRAISRRRNSSSTPVCRLPGTINGSRSALPERHPN